MSKVVQMATAYGGNIEEHLTLYYAETKTTTTKMTSCRFAWCVHYKCNRGLNNRKHTCNPITSVNLGQITCITHSMLTNGYKKCKF